MSNDLTPVGQALTYSGRALLDFMKNSLVLANRVTRAYGGAGGAYGASLEIADLELAGGASVRAIGGAATPTDILTNTRQLAYSHIYQGVVLENIEMFIASVDVQEDMAEQLAYNVAAKMDGTIAALHSEMGWELGELDGTSIFNATDKLDVLNLAALRLSQNKAPQAGRVVVLNPKEAYRYRALENLNKANEAGTAATVRGGELVPSYGFEILESQQIETATLSAAAETASPGAVVGVHARGSVTLAVNGIGAGTVKKGTTFAVAGDSHRYSVTADTAIVGNAATLPIYPALRVATVGAEAVSFTEHTAAASMCLCFVPQAILALNRVPPAWPDGSGIQSVNVSDEQTGFAIRMSIKSALLGGAGEAFSSQLVCDTFFGTKLVRSEWGIKLTGEV